MISGAEYRNLSLNQSTLDLFVMLTIYQYLPILKIRSKRNKLENKQWQKWYNIDIYKQYKISDERLRAYLDSLGNSKSSTVISS